MKSNKNKMNINKILLTNFDNSIIKTGADLSTGNMCTSEYSTLFTNNNFNNKNSYLERLSTPISSTKNIAYNTIDEHARDILYLSKINLQHDIYLSSLKKKLIHIRQERKKSEILVSNLKRKIIELQKEEQLSIKQLENTKKYITNIINNRKRYNIKTNKNCNNLNKKVAKFNTFKINKNPSKNHNKLFTNINTNYIFNTWYEPNKRKSIIKNQNLIHSNCYSEIDNLNYNKEIINEKLMSYKTINTNLDNPKIYSKKKVKFNNKRNKQDKKEINKNINFKEYLIKQLKKDEEEQLKIQKQIEQIEKEQNSLFNNFYENIAFYRSSKTLDLDGN